MLPDSDLQAIIAQVHATPHRLVLEFAGAGSLALWWLHSVAGSSRTILEATDRYAAASLADLLGATPPTFVAIETAVAMARRAYARAQALHPAAEPLLGVGCTATIATDRAKRGAHRCAIAVQRADGAVAYTLTLQKGQRDRPGEEALVSRLLLHAIVQGCDLDLPIALDLGPGEAISATEVSNHERPD